MFADDTKVARIVENEEDGKAMQNVIDALAEWAKKWAMDFNGKKCKVLHFGNKNPSIEYYMNGSMIEACKEEKDLGVIVNETRQTMRCGCKLSKLCLGADSEDFPLPKEDPISATLQNVCKAKTGICGIKLESVARGRHQSIGEGAGTIHKATV